MEYQQLKSAFGLRLKALRKARGLSQEKLAGQVGISVSALSNLERGVGAPRFETTAALAEAFGVEMRDMFEFSRRGHMNANKDRAYLQGLLDSAGADDLRSLRDLLAAARKVSKFAPR